MLRRKRLILPKHKNGTTFVDKQAALYVCMSQTFEKVHAATLADSETDGGAAILLTMVFRQRTTMSLLMQAPLLLKEIRVITEKTTSFCTGRHTT